MEFRKEREHVILEREKPIIHTYNHYAHILSIIQKKPESYQWIFSNFILLFACKNLKKNFWGDFYFPYPYEIKPSDICNWIETSRVRRSYFEGDKDKLIDFLYSELSGESYLYLHLNHESFISLGSKKEKKCHDALIYGIDINAEKLYLADVFYHGRYENAIISFSEFWNAFNSCNLKEDWKFLNDMIYSFKLKESCSYEFNLKNIENSIKTYFLSEPPEYWRLYNQGNREEMIFGIRYYLALIDLTNEMKYEKFKIYIQDYYLLMEHKKIMKLRFMYLCDNKYYDYAKLKEIIQAYAKLEKQAIRIVNMILKFEITDRKNILDNVILYLYEMYHFEYESLESYFNIANIEY